MKKKKETEYPDEKNGWNMRRERRPSETIIHRCIVHGNKE